MTRSRKVMLGAAVLVLILVLAEIFWANILSSG